MAEQSPNDGGMCSISPSDMMGQIDNILTRLERLEETVAQLASADINAIQLSDLSQSAGWIYDVNYLGQPGWTQTPAGTLIPPIGFSLSDILDGAQADQLAGYASAGGLLGPGAGGGNFSWAQANILATANAITSISELVDADGIISVSGSVITITNSGLYLFAMSDAMTINHTAAAYGMLTLTDISFSLPGQATVGLIELQ